MTLVPTANGGLTASVPIDHAAILRAFNINPNDPKAQAMILACDKYGLDPLLKHAVLISGNLYVTRDGLLHVAHRSGLLDGIVVDEEGESPTEWWAKVTVYVKGQSHGYTYSGRYPKSGQQKKYGPEMAVKCAEVMALRRAFGVTGIATVEEQWDKADAYTAEVRPLAPAPIVDVLVARMNALTPEDYRAECKRQFVSVLGKPADLLAEDVQAAEVLVAKFEEGEPHQTAPGPDPSGPPPVSPPGGDSEPSTPAAAGWISRQAETQPSQVGAGSQADTGPVGDTSDGEGQAQAAPAGPEDAWHTLDPQAFQSWQRGARATAKTALDADKDVYGAQWEALVYAESGGRCTSSKELTKDECARVKTRLKDVSSGKCRLVESDDPKFLGWKVES